MHGVVRRATFSRHRTLGGRSLLFGAVIALSVFVFPAMTGAQGGKATDAASKQKPSVKPEELYGDQGGEKVAPAADARKPNTVMRGRREDTFFKLSNPRLGPKGNALLVDYEVVSRGKLDGGTLVLRTDDGGKAEIALTSIVGRDSGTIQLVGAKQLPGNITIRTKGNFPENMEMFVIRGDDRYDPPLKCMVSNSVVMGKMKSTTRARDWTAEEITRFTKGPLAYKNRNGNPTVGEDVPALPAAGAPFQDYRYVDPDGPLLGLDYALGSDKKSLWVVAPVFSADQPKQTAGGGNATRVVARNGYAVAGAEVNTDKFVRGIRLHFCRVKKDGTLDTKDAYAGEWIGTPAESGKATMLVKDGRRVLGVHFHFGNQVDQFALVAEEKEK